MTEHPPLIVWKEAYQTGIDIIDEQHKELVATINSLYSSLTMSSKISALKPAAEMVVEYTKIHFSTEIEMMKKSAYPLTREHHVQHEQLIINAGRTLQACLKEDGDPTDFLHFLKDWFLVHITREDKAYSAHLVEYFENHPDELACPEG